MRSRTRPQATRDHQEEPLRSPGAVRSCPLLRGKGHGRGRITGKGDGGNCTPSVAAGSLYEPRRSRSANSGAADSRRMRRARQRASCCSCFSCGAFYVLWCKTTARSIQRAAPAASFLRLDPKRPGPPPVLTLDDHRRAASDRDLPSSVRYRLHTAANFPQWDVLTAI